MTLRPCGTGREMFQSVLFSAPASFLLIRSRNLPGFMMPSFEQHIVATQPYVFRESAFFGCSQMQEKYFTFS